MYALTTEFFKNQLIDNLYYHNEINKKTIVAIRLCAIRYECRPIRIGSGKYHSAKAQSIPEYRSSLSLCSANPNAKTPKGFIVLLVSWILTQTWIPLQFGIRDWKNKLARGYLICIGCHIIIDLFDLCSISRHHLNGFACPYQVQPAVIFKRKLNAALMGNNIT